MAKHGGGGAVRCTPSPLRVHGLGQGTVFDIRQRGGVTVLGGFQREVGEDAEIDEQQDDV